MLDLDKIRQGAGLLNEGLAQFDPRTMTGEDAAEMVLLLSGVERRVVAAKARSARRVEETRLHKRQGHRDAAHWLASETGESAADSAGLLVAARQMEQLPEVEEAFRSGKLSPAKARQVAGAATCDPSKQGALLKAAERQTLGELRNTCDRVRRQANSAQDEAARYESMRRRRYLRDVTEPDGSVRFDGRVCPDDGAKLRAELMRRARRLAAEARRDGRRERLECYMADALMELVSGTKNGTGTGPEVHVTVEATALRRGYSKSGETCTIAGVGQVPVATARKLLGEGFLSLLVTKGADVATVAHAGRAVPADVDTALNERDKVCCVPGCEVTEPLERDHRVLPFIDGGTTSLANLARLCRWHHYLRTYLGWRLEGEAGNWSWVGPGSGSSSSTGSSSSGSSSSGSSSSDSVSSSAAASASASTSAGDGTFNWGDQADLKGPSG
jgi:hypothetical protein